MKRTLLAASIATLFSTAYGADIQLNPVTASAYNDSLDSDSPKNSFRTPKSSSSHTQIITREEIEQLRPNDAFDVLNMATGVVSSPNNNRMGFSSLSIRGDTNFRWIIDGAYLDQKIAERVMRSIPMAAIEEIKIVRGSSALTLGPMTNTETPTGGGVVNGFIVVSTKKPKTDEAQLRYARESNHGEDQSIWLGKRFDSEGGKAYVAGLVAKTKSGSPSEMLQGQTSSYGYNIDRQFTKGLIKGGFDVAGWDMNWMSYQDDGRYQIPNANQNYPIKDAYGNPLARDWYVDPSTTTINSLSGSKTWDDHNVTLISASTIEARQRVVSTPSTPNDGNSGKFSEQDAQHINIKHNIDLNNTRIMFGGDYRHWRVPYGQSPAYYPGIERREITKGWFVQAEQKLMDGKLNIDGSYRRDSVRVVKGFDYIFWGFSGGYNSSNGQINNKQLPTAEFFSLGSKYNLDKQWALTARYGEANQPANPNYVSSNIQLADDKQKKWELGIEGKLMRELNTALNYFSRNVENEKYIAGYGTDTTCSSLGAYSTSGTVRTYPCYSQANTKRSGFELSISGNFSQRSNYRASWTHFTSLQGGINRFSPGLTVTSGAYTDPLVPLNLQNPSDIAEFAMSHGVNRYTFSGSAKYMTKYYGISNAYTYPLAHGPHSGGYTRLDLGVSYDWKLSDTPMKTTVYGKNITDKKYETSAGIQDVGRILGIELIASFK